MTDLVACLSSGKGTWQHVSKLIAAEKWGKVFLITNTLCEEKYSAEKNTELVFVDISKTIPELSEEIRAKLKSRISGVEVALNMVSGSGKEHMALLSALLKLGFAIRLVTATQEGMKEI